MRIKLGPADFAEGEMRGFEIGKNKNVVVAKLGNRYKALDDWCNHAGCLLSGGRIQANLVVCPCHEVGFDFDSGKNVTSPSVCDDQRAFRISVEEGSLILEDFQP
jgi:3-phenylpropionate/trans-cinnamate dioxygenase ferredoxin component